MPLIEKLKSLTPTEGEWENNEDPDFPYVNIGGSALDTDYIMPDDAELISLAPQMRQELIRMDEELRDVKAQLNLAEIYISELKEENERLKSKHIGIIDSLKNKLPQPKIQMVTACGRFEPALINDHICTNCGKDKHLHVTPPKPNP